MESTEGGQCFGIVVNEVLDRVDGVANCSYVSLQRRPISESTI
jgi:hypothetical protein